MLYKRKLSTKFSKPSHFRNRSSLLDFLILNLRVTRFPLIRPKLPKTTLTFRAVVFVPRKKTCHLLFNFASCLYTTYKRKL